MPDQNKQQAVELLRKSNIPLIEDDVYGALSFKQPRPKSAKAYDVDGAVLYCSSFSKTIAPGIRIGWIVPGKFQEQVEYYKFLQNISTATLSQLALAEFLAKGNYGRHIRKCVRGYRQRMEEFKRWIEEYFPEHTRVTQPQGGMVLWLELPPQIDCIELYRKALEKRVAISPGVLFTAQNQYRHHIRISCGAVEGKKAQTALRLLGGLAKSLL
jgi:DNA-binding transcriptional MocR family regulator